MKKTIFYAVVLFLIMIGKSTSQIVRKPVTEEDYKLWSTVEPEQISDFGNWVSYSVAYESGQDTLFVRHTKTLKTYSIPLGTNGQFASEKYFICQNDKGQLITTQLANGKVQKTEKVTAYKISQEGNFLMFMVNTKDEKQDLIIKNVKENQQKTITNVTNFSYNATAKALICDSNKKLTIINLDKSSNTKVIEESSESNYSDFAWQKNGESVAFLYNNKGITLGQYKVKENKLFNLNPSLFKDFPKDTGIYNSSFTALTISDDGSKIFFGLKESNAEKIPTGIQIWNTADQALYPYLQIINNWKAVPKLAVWFPQASKFKMLTNDKFPFAMVTGDYQYILKYNPLTNDPQFDYNAPIDFYLTNIETGQTKVILTKQSADADKIMVSSAGKYIAFFKDKNWWLYDIKKEVYRNLTKVSTVSFEREDYDRAGEIEVCGLAGWTEKDEEVLIYDNHDIWLFKTDGSNSKRLTNGVNEKIKYRIVPQNEANKVAINFSWMNKGTFKLSDNLVFQAKSNGKSGYFKWQQSNGITEIVWSPNRINNSKFANKNDICFYTSENYNSPPQLIVKRNNKANIIFKSNTQQEKFQWGFSKLINYANSKDEVLNGALFYPANYNPEKKYPMVVQIYERLSDYYNKYFNPTVQNSTGFNVSNFTSQGYFVLLPDIVKEQGKPGASAVDCVVSAVKEVVRNESVDPKKIGLIGHSFGGYETNFIVTQTNKFAAVVSGAGESDMISNYFAVAWNVSKPNGFRHEFQQTNIGVSPFENNEAYIKNSPLTFVSQIETPLLLWSGVEDKQVHYFQSLEFHLALRRLQKPNILVLYENEKHTIVKKENQVDLTHRVQQWFDFYLKEESKPDWLTAHKL